jgi:hypothetical protein
VPLTVASWALGVLRVYTEETLLLPALLRKLWHLSYTVCHGPYSLGSYWQVRLLAKT